MVTHQWTANDRAIYARLKAAGSIKKLSEADRKRLNDIFTKETGLP